MKILNFLFMSYSSVTSVFVIFLNIPHFLKSVIFTVLTMRSLFWSIDSIQQWSNSCHFISCDIKWSDHLSQGFLFCSPLFSVCSPHFFLFSLCILKFCFFTPVKQALCRLHRKICNGKYLSMFHMCPILY